MALTLITISVIVNAEPRLIYDGPQGIDVVFKRCYVHGESCIMDFLVTNNTRSDIKIGVIPSDVLAYDDEGNMYNHHMISEKFGEHQCGAINYSYNLFEMEMPREISLKLQCQISNFDEYAAIIKSIKIALSVRLPNQPFYNTYLQAKDIPVTRE